MVLALFKPVNRRLQIDVLCGDVLRNSISSQYIYFWILFNTTTIYLKKIFLLQSFDSEFLCVNGIYTLDNVLFFIGSPGKKSLGTRLNPCNNIIISNWSVKNISYIDIGKIIENDVGKCFEKYLKKKHFP